MKLCVSVAAAVAAFLLAGSALAHHSFATFDQTKVEHVRGTVKDFEWTNPHTWLHLDLVEGNGAVRTWSFEGGAPEQLASLGWKPERFHAGEKVEIGFRPTKDGSRGGQLLSAKMPNGEHVCANRGCSDGAGGILVRF